MVQGVKNLPARWETWVRFQVWVGKIPWRRAQQSSILAWRIPWTEEPGGLQSRGVAKSWTRLSDEALIENTELAEQVHLLQTLRVPDSTCLSLP